MDPVTMHALGSVASSGIDIIGSSIMANSANAKSKRAAERELWMNKWLMDYQNNYNKPINQMKRLEEAGLNPNLVYGSGADTLSATAGHVGASGITPSKGAVNFIEKMSMLNAMKQQEANIERTNADTDAVNANININKAKLEMERELNDARVRQINAETSWLGNRVDIRNPGSWNNLSNVFETSKLNPMVVLNDVGRNLGGLVYDGLNSIYEGTYSYLTKKFGKRKRR